MKLLGAEEKELAEGDGERTSQLGETKRGRIAAEEEIQDELLAGSNAGDERAAVLRESGRNRIVRALGVIGKDLERRTGGDNRRHGRRPGDRRDEVEAKLRRLATLIRREDVARLLAVMLRTVRNLITAHNHPVHNRSDLDYRFLHIQFFVPFAFGRTFPLSVHYYIGNGRITNHFSRGENESVEKDQ